MNVNGSNFNTPNFNVAPAQENARTKGATNSADKTSNLQEVTSKFGEVVNKVYQLTRVPIKGAPDNAKEKDRSVFYYSGAIMAGVQLTSKIKPTDLAQNSEQKSETPATPGQVAKEIGREVAHKIVEHVVTRLHMTATIPTEMVRSAIRVPELMKKNIENAKVTYQKEAQESPGLARLKAGAKLIGYSAAIITSPVIGTPLMLAAQTVTGLRGFDGMGHKEGWEAKVKGKIDPILQQITGVAVELEHKENLKNMKLVNNQRIKSNTDRRV